MNTQLQPPNSPQPSNLLLASALLAGVALVALNPDREGAMQIAAVMGLGVGLIPALARPLGRLLDRLRTPSAKGRWIIGSILFVLAVFYLEFSAANAGREFIPLYHDEFMYLTQAQMLAHGRLWLPQHPLADFFDSFFILTKPVYAAVYFPGTAMLFVPGIWLGLPPVITSLVISGLIVAMIYVVLTEMIDGVSGILGALLMLALAQFRVLAPMAMSNMAMLLIFLLAFWAYLRWRKTPRLAWALAAGFFAGWALITRPLDALCMLAPVFVAICWQARTLGARRGIAALASMALAASPFIILQLTFDKGVTGHYLHTPVTVYGQANFPGLNMGLGPRAVAPQSPAALPQVQEYYRTFLLPGLEDHGDLGLGQLWIKGRLKNAIDVSYPTSLLLLLAAIGALFIKRNAAAIAIVTGALAVSFAYAFWPPFLAYYGLTSAPGLIALALFGAARLSERFPPARGALALGIAAIAIAALPEIRQVPDQRITAEELGDIKAKLASITHTPAIVLFQYVPGKTYVHREPVYNIDTPNPDDANIIKAQDLGPRNIELFNYYAQRQPNRYIYRYNRATGELTELGYAKSLAGTGQ